MSRPNINISAATYSNGVLSVNIQAYHTRGSVPVTINGFTNSITYTVQGNSKNGVEVATFSTTQIGTTPSGQLNLSVSHSKSSVTNNKSINF